ncbi:MAG: Gfo/Idh/MocA family oxidoreductase [Chloroflexi bacterium]|nr:Gfo/Idh/MocA family oxidoreductase [Chloroflexota bacterium]
MRHKISVGMVGLGSFGSGFVKRFKAHPDVSRIALCDVRADRLAEFAQEIGITETYGSLDEICRSDLDALVIMTPPWMHAPQAIQAMEAGKHVYTAVPIMSDNDGDVILDWCDKLIEAVKRTGQIYMMGETSYYRPEVVFCRKKFQTGELGQVIFVEADYLHDTVGGGLIEVAMTRTGRTREEVMAAGGGAPMHYSTHTACVPISITGAHVTEVSAFGYVFPNDEYFRADSESGNTFSNEVAVYRLSDGSIARLCEFRRVGHVFQEGIVRLLGTAASFELGSDGAQFVTTSQRQPVDVEAYRDPLPEPLASDLGGHGGSHAYLVDEFVSACAEERLPTVNAWEAARYVAAGVIAHKSALRNGELIKVPDWGDAPERLP